MRIAYLEALKAFEFTFDKNEPHIATEKLLRIVKKSKGAIETKPN